MKGMESAQGLGGKHVKSFLAFVAVGSFLVFFDVKNGLIRTPLPVQELSAYLNITTTSNREIGGNVTALQEEPVVQKASMQKDDVKTALPVQEVSAHTNITVNSNSGIGGSATALQEELEQKDSMLKRMKLELEQKNAMLEQTKLELEKKSSVATDNTENTKDQESDNAGSEGKAMEGESKEAPNEANAEDKNNKADQKEASVETPTAKIESKASTAAREGETSEGQKNVKENKESESKGPAPKQQTNEIQSSSSLGQDPNVQSGNAGPKLWIHVERWSEGMAAWRESFAELLSVADWLNATLVEPCVARGRLHTCSFGGNQSRFSEVFDMKPFRDHGVLKTYEEFVEETGYKLNVAHDQLRSRNATTGPFKVYGQCVNRIRQKNHQCKTEFHISATYRGGQPNLDKALTDIQDPSYPHKHAIIELIEYRKWGFGGWVNRDIRPMERKKAYFMKLQKFPPKAFDEVKKMLKILNITAGDDQSMPKFGVIQWRPELPGMDHWMCANAILKARDIMSADTGIPKDKFVLVSALSKRKELTWGGVQHIADAEGSRAYESLDLLFDNGFKKLEQSFGAEVADGSVMVIWDLILASNAESFTTCAKGGRKGCSKSKVCAKCNYQGSSPGLALGLRNENGKGAHTYRCWPE